MPYQVFALKWRPQSFDELVGQSHVVNLLKNSIKKNRLPYAYLFSGPRGVGKTSTARILAKSLNCENGPGVNPCQKCNPCREITRCRSLDVMEIDGASNRGIDEIRTLRENVKFCPSSGRFKIYIIDEVHMLTNEAFNALLKTLEEPPEFVKFIFATTQVNKIPPTILSRCQRLDFRRVPLVDIIGQLKKISAQEKIGLEEEVFFSIARACDGSLRDAESILDQLTSFSQKGKIAVSDVSSLLGVLEQQSLFEITDTIIKKDARGALELLNNMLSQGKDSGIILSNIIEHFRNLIVAKVSLADPNLIDLPPETVKKLLSQSQHFTLEEIFAAFNVLVIAQEMSKKMDSSIIPLEINLIKLAQAKRESPPDAAERTEAYQAKAAGPLPVEEKQKEAPPARQEKAGARQESREEEAPQEEEQPGLEELNMAEVWPKVIDNLGKFKMSLATFLSEGAPVKLEKDTLIISFPNNCSLHKETLERKESRLLIEKVFSEIVKKSLKVKFILSQSGPNQDKPTREKSEKKSSADSFIHSALNAFNARLL